MVLPSRLTGGRPPAAAEPEPLASGRMTSQRLRRFGSLIAVCMLVSSYYVATHYEGWRYQGGQIVNNGLFSQPRFEAPLASVPFNVPGTYEFSFSHFPADDATVMLTTPSAPSEDSIEGLTTEVRIRVIDQNSRIKCDGAGRPRRGQGPRQWVVTSSAGVIGLWHWACTCLQLRACAPCRVEITVGPVDPATPAMLLIPTLSGGGLELP